jgi:hypothetical protein
MMSWIERDNERHDDNLRGRTNRWLVGRALIGLAFTAKGIALLMRVPTTEYAQYAFGALLVLGGIAFIYDSARVLIARMRGRTA